MTPIGGMIISPATPGFAVPPADDADRGVAHSDDCSRRPRQPAAISDADVALHAHGAYQCDFCRRPSIAASGRISSCRRSRRRGSRAQPGHLVFRPALHRHSAYCLDENTITPAIAVMVNFGQLCYGSFSSQIGEPRRRHSCHHLPICIGFAPMCPLPSIIMTIIMK